MQSFCTKEQQFQEIGLEWVLVEKGNVGMSKKATRKPAPIPLLPNLTALPPEQNIRDKFYPEINTIVAVFVAKPDWTDLFDAHIYLQ